MMKPIKAVLVAVCSLGATALLMTACVGSGGGSGDGTYDGESGFPSWQSGEEEFGDYYDDYTNEEDHAHDDSGDDAAGGLSVVAGSDSGVNIEGSGDSGIGTSGETGIGTSGEVGIGTSGEVGIGTSSDTGVGTDGGSVDVDAGSGLPANCITGCTQLLNSDQAALDCLSQAIPDLPLPNNMDECEEGLDYAVDAVGAGSLEEACDQVITVLEACGGATADDVGGSDTTGDDDDDEYSYGVNCDSYCSDLCSGVSDSNGYDACYSSCLDSMNNCN
jgi:hypothetical protein